MCKEVMDSAGYYRDAGEPDAMDGRLARGRLGPCADGELVL
jgi:hypothetical protein